MRRTFDDPDAPYHALRRAFVHKERPRAPRRTSVRAAVAQTGPAPTAADVT